MVRKREGRGGEKGMKSSMSAIAKERNDSTLAERGIGRSAFSRDEKRKEKRCHVPRQERTCFGFAENWS